MGPKERSGTSKLVKGSLYAIPHSTTGKGDRRMATEQAAALLANIKRLQMRLDKASDPVRKAKLEAMLSDSIAKFQLIGLNHYK